MTVAAPCQQTGAGSIGSSSMSIGQKGRQKSACGGFRSLTEEHRKHLQNLAQMRKKQEEEAKAEESAMKERKRRLARRVLSESGRRNSQQQCHPERGATEPVRANENDVCKQGRRTSTSDRNPPEVRGVVARMEEEIQRKRREERNLSPKETIWRRRNKISPERKVFRVVGGYDDVRQELLRRGWVEAPDAVSAHYDLLWCIKARDAQELPLRKDTIVNHFSNTGALTTKSGLVASLSWLNWMPARAHADSFFPRAFNLFGNDGSIDDFLTEFRWTAAASVVKRALVEQTYAFITPRALEVALQVCEWRLHYHRAVVHEDSSELHPLPSLSDDDWSALLDCQCFKKPNANGAADAIAIGSNELGRCKQVSEGLRKRSPQWSLDGMHNLWIVKPASKSRGRGIQVFNNLQDIVKHSGLDAKALREKFIAQKYIERPLLVRGRKFDIRQWVLVTDWNPLTIWFYDTCYLRFCAKDFSLQDLDVFSHLSNNSVAKQSDEFEANMVGESMWFLEDFFNHLKESHGLEPESTWSTIRRGMEEAVLSTLLCSREDVENRKNSFDLYGYDFLLDEDMSPWLLEVNASPTMEHSTAVTKNLCQQVIADTLKLVVDIPDERVRRASEGEPSLPANPAEWDIGMWRILYRESSFVSHPRQALKDLQVSGQSLPVKPGCGGSATGRRKRSPSRATKKHRNSLPKTQTHHHR